ncbi:hypothetical protein [Segatella oulorum]|uniref:hypothetical protein n=1 Tax=Segatella oulorum TaxID=28136 RepID=UPI0028E1C0C7|nr:hypothetical protein [Segatella oulorum]
MKIKQYYSWMVAAVMAVATPFLAACSSEENLAPSRGVAITDAHIVINVEPYGATPTAAKSRAAEAPVVTKPDTVLLANGMRAVVSMEEDAPETQAATRATMDDGHYTIFALDPATGDRITGTKKQLTGTVTGGVFQSDAGSEMILDPGTYKFVCINDAVTDHGTWLEVKTGVSNNNYGSAVGTIPSASDAQIGTATETISGDDWQVTFAMKHQNARIRLRLVAYTNQLENAVGALTGSLAEYPTAIKYALDGSTPVVTEKTLPYDYAIAKLTLSNTPAESNTTYVRAHNFYSNYMYVMPEGEQIALWLGEGKVYGKSFNLASPTKLTDKSLPSKFQRNHSYTITYRLLPEALYLFEDGSCGALAEKGTRTPIGIVYSEKTNTQKGVAMGLQGTVQEWEATTSPTYNGNNYTTAFANTDDALQDENGYNWTWTSSTDVDGLVKANQQTRYPAFYWASHDPYGVGFGEWYFPGIGEIINVFDKLAKKTNVSGMYVTFGKKLDVITNAFVSAGGTDPMNYRCWSSTIYTAPGFSSPIVFYKSGSGGSGYNYTIEVRPQGARKNNLGSILTFPFVRF